jgi:hypothetical protein
VGDQNQQKTTCLLAGLTGENSDSASYTETVRPVPLEIPSFLTLRCNACSSCVFDYLQGHSGEGFQAGRVSTQTGPTSGQQTCSSRGRNPKGSSAANVDKPASREFAREWQFNGLATTRPSDFPEADIWPGTFPTYPAMPGRSETIVSTVAASAPQCPHEGIVREPDCRRSQWIMMAKAFAPLCG